MMIIKDYTSVVIHGNKTSCVIIIYKVDYVTKIEETRNSGMQKGVYVEDNTLFMFYKVCVYSNLNKLCSHLIFKRFLLKLTIESTYMFDSNFYKQSDGITMRDPSSETFSNIYLTTLEIDKIKPTKPLL